MKLKKEFQISLWEDFMDTKINSSNETISFINERKICDIASDSLKNPRAAYNVIFKSKTDGTHELTFDINYRYWDQGEQDFIENPIRKYLYNEAKVKLHYKNRWYDFLIKNCQEDSKEKKFTYTCKDLFIDELGRNGYSAEFSTELGNNVGSPTELAAAALEGSDWTVAPNRLEVEEVIEGEEYSDVPLQRNSEPVYAYTFSEGTIEYKEINEDGTVSDNVGTITAASTDAKTIFICYGSANDSTCEGIDYQFYYNESGYYDTDDDGNFINTRPKYLVNLPDTLKEDGNKLRLQFTEVNHIFQHNYRGYRYIRAQKTVWLDKIKRRVTLYDREQTTDNTGDWTHYGYEKTSYLSPAIAQNILINSGPVFNGTSGWRAFGQESGIEYHIELGGEYGTGTDGVTITLGGDTYLKTYYYNDNGIKSYPNSGIMKYKNFAFKNNLKNIGALTAGEKWIVRIKGNVPVNKPEINYFTIKNEENKLLTDEEKIVIANINNTNDGFHYYLYEVTQSKSYKELLDNPIEFIYKVSIDNNEKIYGVEMFRYYTFKNSNGEDELIIPETRISSQNLIKNEYYYFTQEQYDACRGEEDLQLDSMEDIEPNKDSYVYYENFQKIATIEEKESNYFNIIQTINEKFECWADFQISHEPTGAISVDDTGKRIKRVVFKNYIGKENWAGFKYGINLDNIQRTINSEEITTKTIVKPNSNEFAKYGSCNIARAKGNPTKSQFIIDFDYFINQGILKEFEVNNDLYLEDSGYLGYYTKLNRYNDALLVLEDKLIALENAIQKADITIQASNVGEEDFMEEITSIQEKLAEDIIGVSGEGDTFQKISGSTIFSPIEKTDEGFIEWKYKNQVTFYRLIDESKPNIASSYSPYLPGTTVIYNLTKGKELVDNYNRFINDRYLATNNKRKLEEDKAKLIAQRDGEYSYVDVDGNPRIIRYRDGKWYEVLSEPEIEEVIIEEILSGSSPIVLNTTEKIETGKEYTWSFWNVGTEDDWYWENLIQVATEITIPNTDYFGPGVASEFSPGIDEQYYVYIFQQEEKIMVCKTLNNSFVDFLGSKLKISFTKETGNYIEVENDISPELPINQNLQSLLPSIKQLDSQFYSKYSRFIREGTWISEDYTDDDLYYYDACSVAYTSAFPKTTYSISVVDIKSSIIPDELGYDFSNYDFNCGDLTTMEDVEFFGWKDSEKKTPYRELVLISETEEHLDSPAANKITVQNYKTQFDDLFQRITATTQSLELKQGQYDRASEVVNVNGEINKTFLQNTLYNNNLILQNSGAQGVEWGNKGIITTDLTDSSYMTRIVGGGIVISEDGGATWSTGISGKGINASMIRTGQLDVGKVHIMNGNDISFTWNEYGISGFDKNLAGGYDYSKYTRMDRFGFYAVDGTVDFKPSNENQIWGYKDDGTFDNDNKVIYCLLKDKLRIGRPGSSNAQVKIYGHIYANSLILGTDVDIKFQEKDEQGKDIVITLTDKLNSINSSAGFLKGVTTETDDNGIVTTTFTYSDDSTSTLKTSEDGGYVLTDVGFGSKGEGENDNNNIRGYVKISQQGLLTAYNAVIGGTIYAGGGQIGNWTLEKNNAVYYGPSVLFSNGTGMASRAAATDPAFWAGFDGGDYATPWEYYFNNNYADWSKITKFYVTNEGNMYAKAGNIAGWDIASDGTTGTLTYVYGSGENRYGVGIQANGTGSAVFAAGFKVPEGQSPHNVAWGSENTPFYVTPGGILHATGAVIEGSGTFSGKITATSGNFSDTVTIGGTSVNGAALRKFYATSTGGTKYDGYGVKYIEAETGYCKTGIRVGSSASDLWIGSYNGTYGFTSNNGSVWHHMVLGENSLGYRNIDLALYHSNQDVSKNGQLLMTEQQGTTNILVSLTGDTVDVNGTIYGGTGSDEKIKHTIEKLDDKYEKLFDILQGVTFIYKKNSEYKIGDSQRKHVGFIANNVEEGLKKVGLSTNDFAGFVIQKPGTDKELRVLRYEEFIALNTWQIQKLKTRVTDLETEISNLKLQLENLQNS